MLNNYLRVAVRNLGKNKGYAFINVTGLAVGIACCLLILLLVRHEWSYDNFHANGEQIQRVLIREVAPDGTVGYRDKMPPSMAAEVLAAYPQVDRVTQFVGGTVSVKRGTDALTANAYLADSTLFEMFSFPFLVGDPASALDEPSGAVITEEMARRSFGALDPSAALGQTLLVEAFGNELEVTVTGVTENVPANSSLAFDLVLSFQQYQDGAFILGGNDSGGRSSLYLQLASDADPAVLETALAPFTATTFGGRIEQRRAEGAIAEGEGAFRLTLQPFVDLHLQPEKGVSYERPPYNPTYGVILGGIALLVLLIACINFITLSLGSSTSRAKEVGMRKAIGAGKAQVAGQFWGEALLLSGVAFLFSLGLAWGALPFFNTVTGQELGFGLLIDQTMTPVLGGLLVLVSFVAGGYPSLVLSRVQPVAVLKDQAPGMGRGRFSRSLVVIQYAIAIGMVVCTMGMAQQLDYLLTKDLGFEGDQVVVIQTAAVGTTESERALEVFRNEALPDPSIQNVVRMGYALTYNGDSNGWQGASGNSYEAHMIGADYDFVEVLGMSIIAGRDFDPRFPTDSTQSVLVNEAFVHTYGLETPVGTRLDGSPGFFEEDPIIIGVVEDFNFRSLHETVMPAVINMSPDYYMGMQAMLVKIGPEDVEDSLALLEQTWTGLFPETPFQYSFLDEDMDRLYETEQSWSRIILVAALFAVGIAGLGLFGLAMLTTQQRRKEIGVRKVLGATVPALMALLAKDFVRLVLVAFLFAAPLAYFAMSRWLDGFAYRIGLSPVLFLIAGGLVLGIALLTVSSQTLRAATADPIHALRSE